MTPLTKLVILIAEHTRFPRHIYPQVKALLEESEQELMSSHRLTANTQQLIDVLIIAIAENARDSEVITVEEMRDIVYEFGSLVYAHVEPTPFENDDDFPYGNGR